MRAFQTLAFVVMLALNTHLIQGQSIFGKHMDASDKLANALCDSFSRFAQRDTGIAFGAADRLQKLAPNITDLTIRARAFRCMGLCAEQRNDQAKALELFGLALESLKDKGGKDAGIEKANILMSKGLVYQKNGDLENAFKLYIEAESVFDRYHAYEKLLDLYPKIGDLYLRNQLDTAQNRHYIQKAEGVLPFIKDKSLINHFYIDQANVLFYSGKKAEAFAQLKSVVEELYKEAKPDWYLLGTAFYNMGYYLNQTDKPQEGESYYRKALAAYEKTGSRYDIIDATIRIGSSLYYQKRYAEADVYLQKGLKKAQEMGSKILMRNTYDVLSYLEADRGNYKKAYSYLDRYVTLHLEMLSDKEQTTINFLHAKNEDEKKIGQIQELKDRNQLIWTTSALTLLILVLLLAVLLFRQRLLKNQRRLAQHQVERLEQEKRLVATQAVLDGENAERARLASDLHDGLGGLLSAIKFKLYDSMKNRDDDAERLNEVLILLDHSIDELRRAAHNMMPEPLHKYGLKASLSDFCEGIGLVVFHHYGYEHRLEANLEVMVYRTAMELINNALKYAKANRIDVQVVQQEDRLTLTVTDDGVGFEPQMLENTKGQGLSNIRNRAVVSGGTVDLLTSPGQGCEIVVTYLYASHDSSISGR